MEASLTALPSLESMMRSSQMKSSIISSHNQQSLSPPSQNSVATEPIALGEIWERNGHDVTLPQSHRAKCSKCGEDIHESHMLCADERFWHEDCLRCHCCDCRLGEVGSSLYAKSDLLLCRRDYLRMFGTTGYCAACDKVIPAFELVMRARTNVYHLECFACQQCSHRFCVGDRFYLYSNQIMCEMDYEEAQYLSQHSLTHHPQFFQNNSSLHSSTSGMTFQPSTPHHSLSPLNSTSHHSLSPLNGTSKYISLHLSSSNQTIARNSSQSPLAQLKAQTDGLFLQRGQLQGRPTDDSSSGYDSPSPVRTNILPNAAILNKNDKL